MWLSNFPNTTYYWLLCHKLIDHIWVDLFLGSLFCSTDLYVCVMPVLYCLNYYVVQPLSCVWVFATPWTAAHQASLSFTTYQSLLKLMSIELVMSSNHLILCHPLLLLPSTFPSIRVFSNELALRIAIGEEPRWRRSRTGRTLSPPQIHQKSI